MWGPFHPSRERLLEAPELRCPAELAVAFVRLNAEIVHGAFLGLEVAKESEMPGDGIRSYLSSLLKP